MLALPDLPPAVAVMLACPAPIALTAPDDDTVAMEVLELDHETVPVGTVFPDASRAVAVACVPCPTDTADAPSDTLTVAIEPVGLMMVIGIDPTTPPMVALMTAVPPAIAVTLPLDETDAMPGAELVHVTVRPVNTVPCASFAVALNCVD